MAFKINPPYSTDNMYTQVRFADLGKGVMGRTERDGTIFINKNLSEKDINKVIAHEKIHKKQFENGELDYDDEALYWRGKRYKRTDINMANRNLPWEGPAYKASDKA